MSFFFNNSRLHANSIAAQPDQAASALASAASEAVDGVRLGALRHSSAASDRS